MAPRAAPARAGGSSWRAGLPATVAILALAAGCGTLGFGGRLPPLELYRLGTPDDSALHATADGPGTGAGPVAPGGVAIAPYATPGVYGERGVVYRINRSEYGAYPYREWAVPLATMLGLITQDVLRARPITTEKAVFDPPNRRTYSYEWRGMVRELEEVDRGDSVHATVGLEVRLVRSSDDSVIWVGAARAERPVPTGTMSAIVDSLSRLSADVVARLADEARTALLRSAASAGRPPP